MRHAKIIIPIVILFLLVIGSSIFATSTLTSSSKNLERQVSQIEDSAKDGSWDKAKESLASVENDWSKTEKVWTVLLDHIEIDNIDTTISRLSMFIEAKDKSLTLGEAAALKQYVKHIPEKDSFKLKNIL